MSWADEVKEKISIPAYFYTIIVPNMPGYFDDYICDFNVTPVVKCPIHGEVTPSFRYYDYSNSYYCFGCRSGGGVIQLHRAFQFAMNGVTPSYEEAVTFLYKYFIEGKDVAVIQNAHKLIEYRSTLTDIARLSKYMKNLEGLLLSDKTVEDTIKFRINNSIDEVNQLISLNLCNAQDGIEYIKEVVRSNMVKSSN